MVLFYCETCGVRVAPEDLDDGTARRMDESRALCSACVSQERGARKSPSSGNSADLHITFTDDEASHDASARSETSTAATQGAGESRKSQRMSRGVPVPMAKPVSGEFSRKSTQQLPAARSSSRAHATQAKPAPNKWMAFGAGAGAGIVLIGVVVALMNSSPSEAERASTANTKGGVEAQPKNIEKTPGPNPAPTPTVVVAPPTELPKDPRERDALALLEEAKVYKRTNMDDVYGYAEKLEQLTHAYRATPAGQEAQKLLAAVQYPDPQTQLAPDGAWSGAVNLMELIDTKKDVVGGKWSKSGSVLNVEPDKTTRIQLPYEPPDEYDFKIVFKRVGGEEDVNQMVTARGKALMWSMAASKNSWMGFECVQGKVTAGGAASVKVGKALENNRSYTSIVQVRKRVVRAFLDGKLVKEYRTDYSDFSMRNEWKLKNERVLGLGVHNSKVVFEKIELRAVSGAGKKIR